MPGWDEITRSEGATYDYTVSQLQTFVFQRPNTDAGVALLFMDAYTLLTHHPDLVLQFVDFSYVDERCIFRLVILDCSETAEPRPKTRLGRLKGSLGRLTWASARTHSPEPAKEPEKAPVVDISEQEGSIWLGRSNQNSRHIHQLKLNTGSVCKWVCGNFSTNGFTYRGMPSEVTCPGCRKNINA